MPIYEENPEHQQIYRHAEKLFTQHLRALRMVDTLRGLKGNRFADRQLPSALAELERCKALMVYFVEDDEDDAQFIDEEPFTAETFAAYMTEEGERC